MFTGVITHLGCWLNTQKVSRSLTSGSWIINFYLLMFSHHPTRAKKKKKLTESAVNCLTSKRVIAIQRLNYECYLLADKLLKYASPHETFKGGHPKIFFPQKS